ncbi:MAG: hypothetical protein ABI616_09165 [Pseudomonadota bacterium]
MPAHLVALAATLASQCMTGEVDAPPSVPYAFAAELGSGVYDFGGRTLQVYRLPISWSLRSAESRDNGPRVVGWRLRMPVTAGFLNFRTEDILQGQLPSSIDMLSVAPGVEWEFLPRAGWSVRPYVEAGLIFASGSHVDSINTNAGVQADYTWNPRVGEMRWSTRFSYSRVNYQSCQTDDDMSHLRTGIDWPAAYSFNIGNRPADIGPFAMGEWFMDRPGNDKLGAAIPRFTLETGLMLQLRPMPSIWGFTAPRLGLSYRFAGEFSGFRFVIGETL